MDGHWQKSFANGSIQQQGCTDFAELHEAPQNSRCQKGVIKQVLHLGHIYIYIYILSFTLQNLVTAVTWCTEFVLPCSAECSITKVWDSINVELPKAFQEVCFMEFSVQE